MRETLACLGRQPVLHCVNQDNLQVDSTWPGHLNCVICWAVKGQKARVPPAKCRVCGHLG